MKRVTKRIIQVVGIVMVTVGSLGSLGAWIAATAHFFRSGNNFLGFVSLFVPPAELVLAWVASNQLGLISIGSIVCVMIGATALGLSEQGKTP